MHRDPLLQRIINPRLSQQTNWKARFIREHCSCLQKVCLESIILNVQLIARFLSKLESSSSDIVIFVS